MPLPILPRMLVPHTLRWKVTLAVALALLLHAFMPLFAPTVAAAGSPPEWMEVCSGGQVRLIPVAAPDAESGSLDASPVQTFKLALDDCSLCSQFAASTAASEANRVPPAASAQRVSAFVAFDLPDRHFEWSIDHTRGPPSRS